MPSSPLLALLIVCWISVATLVLGQACSEKPWETVHRRLATKTPYRHIFRDGAYNPIGQIDGCQVRRTWGLFRHGTRNPSKKVIERMNTDLVGIRDDILQHGKLCKKELEMFERWKPMLKIDEEKLLVAEGADEMQQLGKRFRARYGRHLPQDYRKEDFYFKFTKTERAENSARNFSLGLFGRTVDVEYPTALSRDPVLRFYKLCQRWRSEIKHNPEAIREVELFYNSKPMKEAIGRISKKVGTYLDADSIHLMYQTCAFETAWTKRHTSPWCTLFDKLSVKLLEFGEDLEYYWIDGYGYQLTYEQACSAFGDLLKRFDGESEPHTFYFTHSGTLLKAMAFLGLYRDDYPLTHKDFERKRQWRVSEIDAFASNLVFTQLEEKLNDEVAKVRNEQKQADELARDNQLIQLLLRKLIDDSVVTCMLTPRGNCPECWASFERQRKLLEGTQCSCDKEPGIFCLRSMLAVNEKKSLLKYFRCCRGTVPFEFDYRKILEDDVQRPVCPVKKAIRLALGMEENGDVDESEAVDRCMKQMWRCELKLWHERFLKGREEVAQKKTEVDLLDFEYIDSKDPEFLQHLLKRALLKLCEHPKYVLATFPDAYRVPFLNAWIQNRYGVVPSQCERNELLYESKFFWEWLIPRVTAMRWPVCKDLGMQGRVNWNFKTKLERTAQEQLRAFYRKFKRVQMLENRLYWSTMDPYRTNVDRFRQVFFDYLPNCEPLIGPMVRPWHQHEYRPMESLNRALKACDSKSKCL